MAKRAVTLSIEDKVYDRFRHHCKATGLNMSRQVELFMERLGK